MNSCNQHLLGPSLCGFDNWSLKYSITFITWGQGTLVLIQEYLLFEVSQVFGIVAGDYSL